MAEFYNAKNTDLPEIIRTDICIVGAGAMGLTMATYYADRVQNKVLLIESGDEQTDVQTQDLNKMHVPGIPLRNPPDISRMRSLGGSSNCWGGWSRLISETVVKDWPIKYKELLEQTAEVNQIFNLKEGNFDQPQDWYRFKDQYKADWGDDFQVGVRQVRAERFWPTYKQKLKNSKNVSLLYNANAYNVKFKPDLETIEHLQCKTLDGRTIIIEASKFVLACGGLENPLLLLNFDRLNEGVFARKTQLIGSHYSDHHEPSIKYYPLSCFLPAFKNFHEDHDDGQRTHHWVRMYFSLNKERYPEIKTPIALAMQFHPQCLHRTKWDFENLYDRIALKDANFDTPKDNKDPILEEEGADVLYAPTASSSNNVTLTNEKLSTGHYRGKLTYKLLSEDIEQLNSALKIYEKVFRDNGLARLKLGGFNLKYREDQSVYPNGRHHMGGTRMATTAKEGVVDSDLKMFGTKNLYITGPGVFPTFDWMGPTYTAAVLSLRLAKHLTK